MCMDEMTQIVRTDHDVMTISESYVQFEAYEGRLNCVDTTMQPKQQAGCMYEEDLICRIKETSYDKERRRHFPVLVSLNTLGTEVRSHRCLVGALGGMLCVRQHQCDHVATAKQTQI